MMTVIMALRREALFRDSEDDQSKILTIRRRIERIEYIRSIFHKSVLQLLGVDMEI